MTDEIAKGIRLLPGDMREVLASLEPESVDSCVCDPPYHLASIVKRFGKEGSAPAQFGTDGAFSRASRGFMGKEWDGGEIAFEPETWAAVYRVLKPGAHLLAFGAPKNFGFMQVAIAKAGFEMRDVLAWIFGSGFPKSHDVSKGIDSRKDWKPLERLGASIKAARKKLGLSQTEAARLVGLIGPEETLGGGFMWFETGRMPTREEWPRIKIALALGNDFDDAFEAAEREVVGQHKATGPGTNMRNGLGGQQDRLIGDITRPLSDSAREWEGWGTALKPAYEPIIVGQKPVSVENVFAILLTRVTENLWQSNFVAPGAEKSFRDLLVTLREAASSVLANARINVLASIEPALSVVPGSISVELGSTDQQKTKVDIAQLLVRPQNNEELAWAQTIPLGAAADLQIRIAAMCTSVITADTSENIGSLWKGISEDILRAASRFTIETASKLIIALRTLNCSLSLNISSDIGNFKPDTLPIIMARKPLAGTVAQNVLQHGTGAINVDGCRVGLDGGTTRGANGSNAGKPRNTLHGGNFGVETIDAGRWPANVVHDGSEEVLAGFPETTSGANGIEIRGDQNRTAYGAFNGGERSRPYESNCGSAARFFYTAKADSDDRLGSRHPTVKPVDLMQWLVRLVTPKGGLVLDPFAGTGTTGEAAFREGMRAILIEREEEYQADIRRRMQLCLAGPDERRRETIKHKTKDQPANHGPLFSDWESMWDRPLAETNPDYTE